MSEAISILEGGLTLFAPRFPNYPEIGELHGQLSLLLFAQDKYEDAAKHARPALEITEKHFGRRSILTAHRLLRLGAALAGLGQPATALPALREAYDILGEMNQDAAQAEAGFYMDLCVLSNSRDEQSITAIEDNLLANLARMTKGYGGGTMLVTLATAQHTRLVHAAIEKDFHIGEGLLKQHLKVLAAASVTGDGGAEAAVATYKLATLYYANDMLAAAVGRVQEAALLARRHADAGDLEMLCQHRMGMVLAARGDTRQAKKLLEKTLAAYAEMGKQSGAAGMLAKEAEIGLSMCRFFDFLPLGSDAVHAALDELTKKIQELGQSIGQSHMLVQGATKYLGQFYKAASK
eukprot:CAMPEP_0175042804 /NCGR_PEP_ID=MMETSP0052_2-20121109/2791_1 /TAXON_ID=51329 ORGANISM="Polytomella parva, Strain SAG 63-3" /NCGR_SAMPLE_ID=MMETSP0052_2 /ASSEMBLY_ACC=CAM_ASM_000194 /LENGTH=349 /DNA_ID=CAMNT_0016305705 /DNA_START=427 /DNA_END=1476 /DNA_ORIENTATION=-